jgi:pyrroloquinoline quinone (PQQ) biosynthesis protein C
MIADALRLEIEAHAARVRMSNPLLRRAAAGENSPVAVELYLVTLRYMIANTPSHLDRARDRSRETGLDDLATYYREKLAEEDGHERWADHDLRVLRGHRKIVSQPSPVPAAIRLSAFLRRTIEKDPVLYLAYLLWAEYFTTLVGGEVIEHLVSRCHVPADALTCLANHVELDKEHTEENLDALDALVDEPRMLEPLRRVLDTSMALFDRMCEEIVEADLSAINGRVAS